MIPSVEELSFMSGAVYPFPLGVEAALQTHCRGSLSWNALARLG